ncbi:uncharacterized protein Nmag_0202 [Natrialba magadii ATCC 43099]|uniref:Uncharacterized protein n=1 Tax=Natrialba magadii (strain ATCC 43099 / DSM 3394 / CCM 3739 / CIP 104546 / IAM 13178 / JCM 8861 / NBRC 102185 / NCIMB 2190 / MS3) TaxID=547559 RepID=D3SWK2_NATMM|nr:hypothetical protein [Natrialba magadii]ADD03794.1 uncharacterized protein Nmag_0202 [Natrialba magadii ATCC 43099]ELY33848.1 hypothetical protein C500_01453 [Natrialba magadii ATCC 43099]
MTNHAINFQSVVDEIRETGETGGPEPSLVTVDAPDVIDVCRQLFDALESRTDPTTCEFYLHPNNRRVLERRLLADELAVESMPFLERQLWTDVSMPEDVILFMHPDAVTLGGSVIGDHPVGVGRIADE